MNFAIFNSNLSLLEVNRRVSEEAAAIIAAVPKENPSVFRVTRGGEFDFAITKWRIQVNNQVFHFVRACRRFPFGGYCLIAGCNPAKCADGRFYQRQSADVHVVETSEATAATPDHFHRDQTVFYDVARQQQQLRQQRVDNAASSPSRRLCASSPVFVPGVAAVNAVESLHSSTVNVVEAAPQTVFYDVALQQPSRHSDVESSDSGWSSSHYAPNGRSRRNSAAAEAEPPAAQRQQAVFYDVGLQQRHSRRHDADDRSNSRASASSSRAAVAETAAALLVATTRPAQAAVYYDVESQRQRQPEPIEPTANASQRDNVPLKTAIPASQLAPILYLDFLLPAADQPKWGFPTATSDGGVIVYAPEWRNGQVLEADDSVEGGRGRYSSSGYASRGSGSGSGYSTPTRIARQPLAINADDSLPEHVKCARCNDAFSTGDTAPVQCVSHHGKLVRSGDHAKRFSCCEQGVDHPGCTFNSTHVWSGLRPGLNGPFDGFVETQPPTEERADGDYGVYAIDAEMVYTRNGLELAKVSVVGHDGRLVYEQLVRPLAPVVDYNTRFSGITERMLRAGADVKTLRDVQADLLRMFNARTILVGHALNNDLRCLKMLHGTVVDTSVVIPHPRGHPYRLPLRSLAKMHLATDVQAGDDGHCSYEDARCALALLLWQIRLQYV